MDEAADDKLDLGFGTVLAKSESNSQVMVMFTAEEITHFKAIAELARVGLQERDKQKQVVAEREKRRAEVAKKMAAHAERKKRLIQQQQQQQQQQQAQLENHSTSETSYYQNGAAEDSEG